MSRSRMCLLQFHPRSSLGGYGSHQTRSEEMVWPRTNVLMSLHVGKLIRIAQLHLEIATASPIEGQLGAHSMGSVTVTNIMCCIIRDEKPQVCVIQDCSDSDQASSAAWHDCNIFPP